MTSLARPALSAVHVVPGYFVGFPGGPCSGLLPGMGRGPRLGALAPRPPAGGAAAAPAPGARAGRAGARLTTENDPALAIGSGTCTSVRLPYVESPVCCMHHREEDEHITERRVRWIHRRGRRPEGTPANSHFRPKKCYLFS